MAVDYVLQPFRSPIELQIDYAGELNEQQFAAVTASPGPSLVIAGAGSGKTRTLTYRVAWLLEQQVPPERILLLTFTNKAAKEMMRRVTDLLGQELDTLWGGTFHSLGNRILRQHAALLGYQRDFSILDREDGRHLIATCIAESNIDSAAARFPKADVLSDIFSLAVNKQKPVAAILNEEYGHYSSFAKEIADLQGRYADRKRATNAMDFDDLLVRWLQLLQEHQDVREHYQRRFQFILVDEYQDTNRLQSDIIDLLGARHHNVMVVGDDAQSIYAWRGANFQNILKFPERYPGAKVFKIETNYRSTPEILNLANAAIRANLHQFTKQLAPARKTGARPALVACGDASVQAAFVAQRVLQLREEGGDVNKMAVLYRSHFHALELQLELTRRGIAFSITSGIRFFEQAHIKDVAAYLKLVLNPKDELSFKRLARLLPGIGGKGAEKLWKVFAEQNAGETPNSKLQTPSGEGAKARGQESEVRGQKPEGGSQGAEIKSQKSEVRSQRLEGRKGQKEGQGARGESAEPVARALQGCAALVPKKAAVAWAQFVATVAQLEARAVRDKPADMIRLVIEAGYKDYLAEHYTNPRSRLDDLENVAVFARQYSATEDFLTELALLTSVEAEAEQPVDKDDERLRLSTIHQAKGLEFDVVFVIMLCDGLFPSARSLENPDAEEEERRLLYVAITRARNELYLSYPLIRAGYGSGGDLAQHRSRFIDELPTELIEEWNLKQYG